MKKYINANKIVKLFFLFALVLTMASAISLPTRAASTGLLKDVRKAPVKKRGLDKERK
ncbi:hypothetical protein [Robinsoniella sp. RHS]|uniref:hypothetical protein n=1 Tax=Robinsoniella sp. RHS TaxID=1504536 RepID=UPI00267F215D